MNSISGKIKFLASLLLIVAASFTTIYIKAEKHKTNNTSHSLNETEDDELTGCGGTERWQVKVFTDSLANTIDFNPKNTTIAHLISIYTPISYFTMPRFREIEDSTYTINCDMTVKKVESDSDYHLVLSDGINTMIGEIPDPECSSVSSSPKANQFIVARNWVKTNIGSGDVLNLNVPVTVTGVAFVDTMHGQIGAAPNQLELHSIIDIHYDSAAGLSNLGNKQAEIFVFPNPFDDYTTIRIYNEYPDMNDMFFILFDMTGKKVLEFRLQESYSTNFILPRGYLKSGIYVYCIRNKENYLHADKLVVE